MIEEKTLRQFLDELASKASTPGGGSAAAIIGAMGAALVSMVCNLTIGKKNYADVEDEFNALLQKAETLREQLTGMVKADIEVFNKVMGAYGLSRDTDDEKAARTQAIQAALKEATVVPLSCAHACADVINLSKTAAEKGNLNVISDAGVAVLAAYAALRSAALNVHINIGAIKDEAFVNEKRAELQGVLAGTDQLTEEVYALVKSKL
ncbi:MAG: cyclodeaminase/cyclohydrolase family protein [Gammaproteobacteria bacterium]